MTVGDLCDYLDGRDSSHELGAFLDGVQGEGVTKPRPILGFAEVDDQILLVIGKRGTP